MISKSLLIVKVMKWIALWRGKPSEIDDALASDTASDLPGLPIRKPIGITGSASLDVKLSVSVGRHDA